METSFQWSRQNSTSTQQVIYRLQSDFLIQQEPNTYHMGKCLPCEKRQPGALAHSGYSVFRDLAQCPAHNRCPHRLCSAPLLLLCQTLGMSQAHMRCPRHPSLSKANRTVVSGVGCGDGLRAQVFSKQMNPKNIQALYALTPQYFSTIQGLQQMFRG